MPITVILVSGYAFVLLATAYAFDAMARHVAVRAQRWRTGAFRFHRDHDAWTCPQDQWLWPTSYDPEQRIVRYRAKPSVCNACPVKSTCTTSSHGRELTREIDSWPHSEAGRFHRGLACCVAGLGILLPAGLLITNHGPYEVLLLASTIAVVALAGVPLARHLWRSPSGFPPHIPQRAVYEPAPPDRFATRWSSLVRKDPS